jgi:iron only hydrogenase large subunit-like protein
MDQDQKLFYHALKIRTDLCIGCTHCMKVCPTEAIRIKLGKAILFEHRCVDCGECFRACPVCAIIVEQDDFNQIFNFPIRIALLPAVFTGQFPEEISIEEIYSELMDLGFTHVFEVDHGAEILLGIQDQYVKDHPENKPMISPYCPAIVRLIQVKFPSLVENILLMKPPVDIAAIYTRKKFMDEGHKTEEIGLFYVTPCAAKIAAVKSPVGEDFSEIDGVINMNFLFNKVFTSIKQSKKGSCQIPFRKPLNDKCIVWSLTRGESATISGRSLAIDGIHNVIEILERIETQENTDIDFLELRACDESCAGGVLTSENRFLTVERLHNRADIAKKKLMKGLRERESILNYKDFLESRLFLKKVKPRSMMKLDDNMTEALRKIKKVHELMVFLPNVDCGICGCPSCSALAEDVVQGRGTLAQCMFVQRTLEDRKIFTEEESLETLNTIWSKEKFNRKWLLNF